ncbi:MAG: acyl-CoA dehydrogenase [Deltaproteobacteria bacterium]|jgi:butyryl-CoA dehydrogenase|nr:acyl-CoA dehydrogenase [Deltaproteobacteria bacterium]
MAGKFYSERNLKFMLYEVHDVVSLTQYDYYAEHNRKMFDMVLKAAGKVAKDLLFPVFEEMDRNQPELVNGEVKVHPAVRKIMTEFGEGGWITARVPFELDGEQLPHLIADTCEYLFQCANYSANAYHGLTVGAANLIETFGSKELYDTYTPKMYQGKWQGTMALTEPEAGSSLSDITTMAEPTHEDYYSIKGQKIFISAGDHDGVDNVVHLMLAKIEGAPAGVKGISLFVVPKKRLDANGRLVGNDVVTSGVYHKLGYRGCPIVQLSLGDKNNCRGWLVGEPHNGLKYMFLMMNGARIGVGLGAAAMSTAAYYAALEYAKTRRQGRNVSQKDPTLPPVPIIEHADVKRMLLFQRAVNEGGVSILMQCSKYLDLQHVVSDEEKEKYILMLEILTPIAKTYPSEMGIQAISQGLQCLGGSGYCDDYPLEQYYRDARIHPIHEGTTGIQAMDLLGRKVVMQNGRAFRLLVAEVANTVSIAMTFAALQEPARQLESALSNLQEVTGHLLKIAQEKGPEYFLADATLYLELFGIVAAAWQWLLQGIAAQDAMGNHVKKKDLNFYHGKMAALRYFFGYELPKASGLTQRLMQTDGLTVEMGTELFND